MRRANTVPARDVAVGFDDMDDVSARRRLDTAPVGRDLTSGHRHP
jgi:hypothetical protein